MPGVIDRRHRIIVSGPVSDRVIDVAVTRAFELLAEPAGARGDQVVRILENDLLALEPEAKEVLLPFSHLLGDPSDRVAQEEAQATAERMAKPGVRWQSVGVAARNVLAEGLAKENTNEFT